MSDQENFRLCRQKARQTAEGLHIFRLLQRGKELEQFVFMDGHYLVSLDGTGYFSSSKIHCPSCLEKNYRGGNVNYSHQMLGAALVKPGLKEVIPLAPEPIIRVR